MSGSIYKIFVQYHLNAAGTATITTEELFYSIPITDSTNAVKDPVVKCEMGKSGSFEFSITPVHPFYNRFKQMHTIMRVEYDGETIFRGRVLTIDSNQMNGTKKIHLEGDLAFLMDSYQEGAEDADRPTTDIFTYLSGIIQSHNDQMNIEGSQYKQFKLGEVPGNYHLAVIEQQITVPNFKFGFSGWKKTQDALNDLTKTYGGYLHTRRGTENGVEVIYLDWLETFFNQYENNQPIKVTENIIDLNSVSEVNNIFTVLIPIGTDSKSKKIYIDDYYEQYHGDNKSVTVPQMAAYMNAVGRGGELSRGFHKASDYENAISDHGVIYITQEFNNADTKQKLWDEAINWIRDNYNGKIINFTSTALDRHHINPNSFNNYNVGDQVTIAYPDMSRHTNGNTPFETKKLTLLSATYNLHNPEKNSYTIGIPNSLLSKSPDRTSKKKTKSDAKTKNNDQNQQSENQQWIQSFKEAAEVFVISKEFNSEEYQELVDRDPEKANVAVKVTTLLVNSVYKATRGEMITIQTTTHKQRSTDVDSIYKTSNGAQWKIKKVYSTQIHITPVEDGSVLPTSGTMTWVSGGVVHTTITYTGFQKGTNPQMWAFVDSHDKSTGGRDVGSVYKASNNTEWEIVTIQKNKIRLMPVLFSSKLPDSGILTHVSGGTHTSDIIYGKTESDVQNIVSQIATMTADGNNGRFIIGKAIPDDGSYTKEEIELINTFNKNVVLDAANSELSLSSPLQFDEHGHITNFPEVLASMGLDEEQKNGLLKMWNEGKLDDPNAAESVSLTGSNGAVNSILAIFGLDGTGGKGTINISGSGSSFEMKDPSKAGSSNPVDIMLELFGGNGGQAGVGKKDDPDHPGQKKWMITMNKNLAWTDKDGNVHYVPSGTVGAEDYFLEDVPSFHSEFAYINTIVADYVATKNLIVENNAFINNLIGSTAVIEKLTAKKMVASSYFSSPSYCLSGVGDEGDDVAYLQNCFSNCLVWAGTGTGGSNNDKGKIYFQFSKIGGGVAQTVNFNIADTQFYKDAVSAAKLSGWAECYDSFSVLGTTDSKTLSYDESAVVKVTQKRADGTVATRLERTYTAPSDRYSSGWSKCYDSFSVLGTTASKTLDYGESAVVNVTQKRADGTVATRLERTYTAPSGGGSGTIDIQTRNQGGCGLYSTTLPVAYTYHELYTWVNSSTTPNPKTAKYVTFVVTCGNADKRYYYIDLSKFR